MRCADRGARLAAALAVSVAASVVATPARGDELGPTTHTLEWDELGRWRGYRLGGLRIEDAFVSEPSRH